MKLATNFSKEHVYLIQLHATEGAKNIYNVKKIYYHFSETTIHHFNIHCLTQQNVVLYLDQLLLFVRLVLGYFLGKGHWCCYGM